MKKILLSVMAFATITFSAAAQTKRATPGNKENASKENEHQEGGRQKKHSKMHGHQLAKTLNFTDAQEQQLKSINVDYKKQASELEKATNMSAEQLASKKIELRRQKMQKTMALLTPEQETKLQSIKKENGGKGKMSPDKRMEKMQTSLGLSAEQVEKMKAQKDMFTSKKESIRNNQSLSMEQKKEQLKSLKDEQMNSFKSFLTPDQLKKMEDMRHKKSMKAA